MKKISPKFFNYLLLIMLGLAFVFPLTHSTYEGMTSELEEDEEEEKVDQENFYPGRNKLRRI
jgi:hypothetical protein